MVYLIKQQHMEQQLEQIREQQRQVWDKFSPGWRKWDTLVMNFMQPMGEEIIQRLRLKETDNVLDIAGGTGEPGLTIAPILKKGKVIITDLSEGMLAVARDNATKKGITNYETLACDVSELPFNDGSFDKISCRMGFMFFPDMLMAAKEMVRVLKPGGIIATSVWATPDKNPWVTMIMSVINKNLNLPAPPPGAPGMFRCGNPGFIAEIFRQAGLKNVVEKEITGKLQAVSAENYWNFHNDVAAPIVAAMSKADEATKAIIKKEVFELVNRKYPDKKTAIDFAAIVISGEK
jgi:ubiquinone/menaquinone biosynthesis C-methylase UbiE